MRSDISAVDLFCGIGGLSYGLKQSGIEIKAGFDFDNKCKYAYETNCNAPFIHEDIANLTNRLCSLSAIFYIYWVR